MTSDRLTNLDSLTVKQRQTLDAIDDGHRNAFELSEHLDITQSAARGRAKILTAKGLVDTGWASNGEDRDYHSYELSNLGMNLIEKEDDAKEDAETEHETIERMVRDEKDRCVGCGGTTDLVETNETDNDGNVLMSCGPCDTKATDTKAINFWDMETITGSTVSYNRCRNCGKTYGAHGAGVAEAGKAGVPASRRHLICPGQVRVPEVNADGSKDPDRCQCLRGMTRFLFVPSAAGHGATLATDRAGANAETQGVNPGWYTRNAVVDLLRDNAANPETIRFLADMLEV